MINSLKIRTKTLFIASMLFMAIFLLVLPAKAADLCCETKYNSSGITAGSKPTYKFVKTEKECTDIMGSDRSSRITSDISKCEGKKQAPVNLPNLKLDAPDLKVSIPGASKLKSVTCTETSCSIPWFAQYIASLQKYAIGIIGILATITIMMGGIIWLTAAGNSNQVSSAKNWITGGLTGLVLVLGSYLLLSIINPQLTVLKSLDITRINQIDLDELIQTDHEPDFDPSNAKPITDTTYDETFKNFAACIGVDWRILKGIAYKESGLRADSNKNNNKTYKGLFQTRQEYCIESVKRIGLSSDFCKAGVFDPAVNTAIATGMMKINLETINSKCASSGNGTKIFLLYFGHSSGSGALKNALNNKDWGCNIDKWPDSKPPFVGATKDYVKQTVETVLAQGVTNVQNTSENKQCPKK